MKYQNTEFTNVFICSTFGQNLLCNMQIKSIFKLQKFLIKAKPHSERTYEYEYKKLFIILYINTKTFMLI